MQQQQNKWEHHAAYARASQLLQLLTFHSGHILYTLPGTPYTPASSDCSLLGVKYRSCSSSHSTSDTSVTPYQVHLTPHGTVACLACRTARAAPHIRLWTHSLHQPPYTLHPNDLCRSSRSHVCRYEMLCKARITQIPPVSNRPQRANMIYNSRS